MEIKNDILFAIIFGFILGTLIVSSIFAAWMFSTINNFEDKLDKYRAEFDEKFMVIVNRNGEKETLYPNQVLAILLEQYLKDNKLTK